MQKKLNPYQMSLVNEVADLWREYKRSRAADFEALQRELAARRAREQGRLRDAVKKALDAGVSKSALAREAGMSRPSVYAWLGGEEEEE